MPKFAIAIFLTPQTSSSARYVVLASRRGCLQRRGAAEAAGLAAQEPNQRGARRESVLRFGLGRARRGGPTRMQQGSLAIPFFHQCLVKTWPANLCVFVAGDADTARGFGGIRGGVISVGGGRPRFTGTAGLLHRHRPDGRSLRQGASPSIELITPSRRSSIEKRPACRLCRRERRSGFAMRPWFWRKGAARVIMRRGELSSTGDGVPRVGRSFHTLDIAVVLFSRSWADLEFFREKASF